MHTALGRSLVIGLVSVTLAACGKGEQSILSDSGETFQQVARAIIHAQDQVSVQELADWLIKDRQDFALVDVRPQSVYEEGPIESAINLPLTYLVEPGVIGGLPSDRLVVLYSENTRKAAQAIVLLRLAGVEASTLTGGYEAWEAQVLHPELSATTDEELLEARKRQAIACYFAGNYKGGTGQDVPQSAAFIPSLSSPLPVAQGATGATAYTGEGEVAIEEGC